MGTGGRETGERPMCPDVGNKSSTGALYRLACSSEEQFYAHGKRTSFENLLSKMEAAATGFQKARNYIRAPWG